MERTEKNGKKKGILSRNKSLIIKIIIILCVLVGVSVGLYFLFRFLGITDVNRLQEIIASTGPWAVVVFIAIETVVTILLCFVPATSMTFILVAVALFGANWKTFLICAGSVFLSSMIMYLLGRFGGRKVVSKIIGEKEIDSAEKLIKEKGQIFFPVMMAVAGFPDDALVCMAGMTRMNLAFFIPSVLIGRSVGIATIVFGISLVPFSSFTTIYDWFVFISVCAFWIIVIIYVGNWINKKISAYKKKKEEQDRNDLE